MPFLTNRELATLILFCVFILFAASKADVRRAFVSLAKAFFKFKLVAPLIGYLAILSAGVWMADTVGLWERSQIKDTVLWFIGSGLALFVNLNDAGAKPRYFARTVRSTVTFGVVYGFFINITSFNLVIEIVGQLIVAILSLMIVFSESDKQYAPVKKPCSALLGMIALMATVITSRFLYVHRHILDFGDIVRTFALPIWLTILALPCIFMLALLSEYETAFLRLSLENGRNRIRWKTKFGVLLGLNLQIRSVHDLVGHGVSKIVSAPTLRETYLATLEFREERARKHADEQAARDRLVRFAGIQGVNSKGLRLDRREFEETRRALLWLSSCHMGWYRNHGNRYQKDLLEKLSDFSLHGLTGEHKIEMRVRKDGQAWYAWRRAITGWVFAIGAAKAPSDQWLYDGPVPPKSFPGSDPLWTGPMNVVSPNWCEE